VEDLIKRIALLENGFKDFKAETAERIKRLENAARKAITHKIDEITKSNTTFLKKKYEYFSGVNQLSDTRYRVTVYGSAAKMLGHEANKTKDKMISYVILGDEIVLRTFGENKKRFRTSAQSLSIDIHAAFDFTSMYCPVDCKASDGQLIVRIDLGSRIDPRTTEVMVV